MRDTVYICCMPWTVEYVDGPVVDGDGNGVLGLTDQEALEIRIDGRLAPEQIKRTLFHELGHAAHRSNTGEHPDDEERCVRNTEYAWYSIFADPRNTEFVTRRILA